MSNEGKFMNKLTLRPSGEVIEVKDGQNLLEACREKGIYLKSSCGGHATCSDCVIKVVSGQDLITPPPFEELKILGNVFHITKERLACQTCLTGDVTIDISKHDKDADEARMKNKAQSFQKQKSQTKIRTTKDIEELKKEKMERKAELQTKDREWQKHWDKNGQAPQDGSMPKKPKKLDGNRRPKYFSTDGLENMVKGEDSEQVDITKKNNVRNSERKFEKSEYKKDAKKEKNKTENSNQNFKSFRDKSNK